MTAFYGYVNFISQSMNRKTLTFYLLLFSVTVSAQRLTGRVLEEGVEAPIPYATIYIQGSTRGTVSNPEGEFRVDISGTKNSDTLIISHIGFETKPIVLKDLSANPVIFLKKSALFLHEVTVIAENENKYARDLFREVYETTKRNLATPAEVQTYCQQLVLQDNQLTKYADAQLASIYTPDKDKMLTRIEQIRIVQLPIENDNFIDMANPTRVDKLIELAYLAILERFVDERCVQYDFKHYDDPASPGYYFLIEPGKEDTRENSEDNRYSAIVKVDPQKNIQEIHFSLDSTRSYGKSLLGIKVRVKDYVVLLQLRNIHGLNYFYYGKMNVKMDIDAGKKHQSVNFVSEMLNFSINLENPRFDTYKKGSKISSLFKYDNHYTFSFWDRPEIPPRTAADNELLNKLKALQKEDMSH